MEYERIHKLQVTAPPPVHLANLLYCKCVGIISPSKLRMKLMGQRKKDGGSKSNSARTSPSKLEDTEFVKNSLLASNSGISDEEGSTMALSSLTFDSSETGQGPGQPKKTHQFQKPDSSNSSSVHPIRSLEDENLDYDSNASSSSFEFHKGEQQRSSHNAISRSLLRPMSSKWNDAEKWIINRQNLHNHNSKNNRVNRAAVKRVDFCPPGLQMGPEKFSFTPSGQASRLGESTDPCPESKDLKEVDLCGPSSNEDKSDCHEVRSVSMRDIGTEMTPIPSQEPSMTSTPVGATTPLRSPNSSIPSTPRRAGPPNSTPVDHDESRELTEQEVKLRTRKEILQLGVQLGKMNIAAWASKEDLEKQEGKTVILKEEELRVEFEKRAVAWEDAEKSKHNARFIREEIKIEAWESQQKAKLEAEMRRIEIEVEQKRAHAQAKMMKNIAIASQKSEAKRAAAEAQKSRRAARAAAQAEYIRQTGRIPPSSPHSCCGWS
ncbi:hypothetical protein LXL04_027486 [Taraxacum kok-saghyz]